MLDPQVDAVRLMVDTTAERIAALGGRLSAPPAPWPPPGWDDYSIGRADAIAHMGALRWSTPGSSRPTEAAIDAAEETDLVTQDMLIGQTARLRSSSGSSGAPGEPLRGPGDFGDPDRERRGRQGGAGVSPDHGRLERTRVSPELSRA